MIAATASVASVLLSICMAACGNDVRKTNGDRPGLNGVDVDALESTALIFAAGGENRGIYLADEESVVWLGDGGAPVVNAALGRIVFTSGTNEINKRICVGEIIDRSLRDVDCGRRGTDPALSSKGDKVAFVHAGIWTMSPDGGDVHKVFGDARYEGELSWSPNSMFLALLRPARGIEIIELHTGEASTIPGSIRASAATWRPMEPLELTFARPDGVSGFEIIVRSFVEGRERVLLKVDAVVRDLAWSPSGRYLAYTYHPETADVLSDLANTEIAIYDLETKSTHAVTDNAIAEFAPKASGSASGTSPIACERHDKWSGDWQGLRKDWVDVFYADSSAYVLRSSADGASG